MTRASSHYDPTALAAARHLNEFGYVGWHLRLARPTRPVKGKVVDSADRFERQVAHADHFASEDFPKHEDSAVFLLKGAPRPEVGDELIALTRCWLIKQIAVVHPGNREAIYAVYCV